MENENDFRIRTYTKRELACLIAPTQRHGVLSVR